jgi:hypothetical protein
MVSIYNRWEACFDCSCRRMQFSKLLKEKCFYCNLQCLDSKKSIFYEEQYIVDLLRSLRNVTEDEFRHFLAFSNRLPLHRHKILGIIDQLLNLATYLDKLSRSVLRRKKIRRYERGSEVGSKHRQNRQSRRLFEDPFEYKGKLKNNLSVITVVNAYMVYTVSVYSFVVVVVHFCLVSIIDCAIINSTFYPACNLYRYYCTGCTGSVCINLSCHTCPRFDSPLECTFLRVNELTFDVDVSLSTSFFIFKELEPVDERRDNKQDSYLDVGVINSDLVLIKKERDRDDQKKRCRILLICPNFDDFLGQEFLFRKRLQRRAKLVKNDGQRDHCTYDRIIFLNWFFYLYIVRRVILVKGLSEREQTSGSFVCTFSFLLWSVTAFCSINLVKLEISNRYPATLSITNILLLYRTFMISRLFSFINDTNNRIIDYINHLSYSRHESLGLHTRTDIRFYQILFYSIFIVFLSFCKTLKVYLNYYVDLSNFKLILTSCKDHNNYIYSNLIAWVSSSLANEHLGICLLLLLSGDVERNPGPFLNNKKLVILTQTCRGLNNNMKLRHLMSNKNRIVKSEHLITAL